MNQIMSLKAMVDQISNQLEIADHHEESRYLPVIEDHPTRVYTSNESDFFLVPTDSEIEA